MKRVMMTVGIMMPNIVCAQAAGRWSDSIQNLHAVLEQVYNDMLPLCSQLIGVGSGLAGFAALFYIAYRVWGHIARTEPIDFYPLFRPFVLGFCVLNFLLVVQTLNGLLQPTVAATNAMVNSSNLAITALLAQKEAAIQSTDAYQLYVGPSGEGDPDRWYKYTHPDDPAHENEGWIEGIGNDLKFAMAKASYNFGNAIKEVFAEVLQLLFAAASLCINTLRTFNLIVLAILGPLVFGISVFDGFHHTLRQWLARYINYFLWLPVANIFGAIIGKIQENMLKIDLSQISQHGVTFFSRTDAAYLVFLFIGIVGYLRVPSIANYVVFAGGSGLSRVVTAYATGAATGGVSTMVNTAIGGISQVGGGISNTMSAAGDVYNGYGQAGSGTGGWARAGRAYGQATHYLHQKLKGN
jgi:conjugative transposon TraJ protein